ncbi:PilZ domain-containing protein [Sphingomonas sp. BN140010]|uniref:PilZ domain-containing protein n=1 Tax=Sphingomonas arvum TaxID=2992113 RepID=A0ABT3JIB7_9SPHN|nr:PilZ domain-containing protein [Sphingomonas sp. BN140010]MCW3798832.1 PilZ domain-containing protein [Sphingomonas sp. BN140010]
MGKRPVETTLYSLSNQPPAQQPERRDDERHMTLFRVGTLIVGDRRDLCLIKNISAGGLMLRRYCQLHVGQRIAVELKTGQPIAGSVSWVGESQAGMAFDQPIDVLSILATDEEGPRPRMPRIETQAAVYVRAGAQTWRLQCCDVSQGGVKLVAAAPLTAGSDVVVTLSGLPPQPGVVRWSAGEHAGISFNRPLSLTDLVGWLQGQRDSSRAA